MTQKGPFLSGAKGPSLYSLYNYTSHNSHYVH
jgi:hypothetical protein